MSTRLVIDGNAVYEIDEDCLECQEKKSIFRDGKNGRSADSVNRRTEDRDRAGK